MAVLDCQRPAANAGLVNKTTLLKIGRVNTVGSKPGISGKNIMQDTIFVELDGLSLQDAEVQDTEVQNSLASPDVSPDAFVSVRWSLSGFNNNAGFNKKPGSNKPPAQNNEAGQFAGSMTEFRHWLRSHQSAHKDGLRAVLLLSGDQVVSRTLEFAENEKKHLHKMLPFMLESQLAVDLAQVHVAHSLLKNSSDSFVQLAYTDKKTLFGRVAVLESLGLEVEQVFSMPALLPATATHWTLLLDGDRCHLHAAPLTCTTVAAGMLPVLMDVLLAEASAKSAMPGKLTVYFCDNKPACAETALLLEKTLAGLQAAGIAVVSEHVSDSWRCFDVHSEHAVNLRQGEFAAPLRIGKYWQQWRVPALAAMLAITAVLLAAVIETQINQYRLRALESRIEQRYRDVMPEGVLVDAVQQLSAQIAQRRSASSTQSLISMLDVMLEPFESADNISLQRLSYNSGAQTGGLTEIQLSITAASAAEILQLSEQLNTTGLNTQAQNISRVGEAQQASLIVRGAAN